MPASVSIWANSPNEVFAWRPKQRQDLQLLIFLLSYLVTRVAGSLQSVLDAINHVLRVWISSTDEPVQQHLVSKCAAFQPPSLSLMVLHALHLLLLGSSSSCVGQVSHSPGKTLQGFHCWLAVVAFHFFSKTHQLMEGFKVYHCN